MFLCHKEAVKLLIKLFIAIFISFWNKHDGNRYKIPGEFAGTKKKMEQPVYCESLDNYFVMFIFECDVHDTTIQDFIKPATDGNKICICIVSKVKSKYLGLLANYAHIFYF